jgi:hypothetical protein
LFVFQINASQLYRIKKTNANFIDGSLSFDNGFKFAEGKICSSFLHKRNAEKQKKQDIQKNDSHYNGCEYFYYLFEQKSRAVPVVIKLFDTQK